MAVELLQGDCMDYMKKLEDNAFELAIVDPPYGIGNWIPSNVSKKGKKASKEVNWNNSIPSKGYFAEVERVSKERIIWGANYYNCFSESGAALVWHKGNINPIFSQCEIASLSFGKKVDYCFINWQAGFYRENAKGEQIHPCQKPVKLYEWLLKNYAKEGDRILDTHLGSGSSAIAAHYGGFDFVGIELDEDYYKAACERFDMQTKQYAMVL